MKCFLDGMNWTCRGNTQDLGTILVWTRSTLAHCTLGSYEGIGLDVTELENAFRGHSYCTQAANGSPVHKPKRSMFESDSAGSQIGKPWPQDIISFSSTSCVLYQPWQGKAQAFQPLPSSLLKFLHLVIPFNSERYFTLQHKLHTKSMTLLSQNRSFFKMKHSTWLQTKFFSPPKMPVGRRFQNFDFCSSLRWK